MQQSLLSNREYIDSTDSSDNNVIKLNVDIWHDHLPVPDTIIPMDPPEPFIEVGCNPSFIALLITILFIILMILLLILGILL